MDKLVNANVFVYVGTISWAIALRIIHYGDQSWYPDQVQLMVAAAKFRHWPLVHRIDCAEGYGIKPYLHIQIRGIYSSPLFAELNKHLFGYGVYYSWIHPVRCILCGQPAETLLITIIWAVFEDISLDILGW